MNTHNIGFYGELKKLSSNYHQIRNVTLLFRKYTYTLSLSCHYNMFDQNACMSLMLHCMWTERNEAYCIVLLSYRMCM